VRGIDLVSEKVLMTDIIYGPILLTTYVFQFPLNSVYSKKSNVESSVFKANGTSGTNFIILVPGHEKKALYYQEIKNICAILEL
jgi:hypothetical protein